MGKTGRALRVLLACALLLAAVAAPALAAALVGTKGDVLVGTDGRDQIDGRRRRDLRTSGER